MIYDTGEYGIKLKIPTDNFLFHHFWAEQANDIQNFVDNLKNDIRDKNTLIILFGGFHNLYNYEKWIPILNTLSNDIPNAIVLFDGNLGKKMSTIPKFYYRSILMFERVSALYYKKYIRENVTLARFDSDKNITKADKIFGNRINDFFHSDREKKFYWASSKDYYQRRYLLSGLIQKNLLNEGLVNYKCVNSFLTDDFLHYDFEKKYHELIQKECQSIDHLVPLQPLDDTIEFNMTDPQFYYNSYCSIITDTFYTFGPFFSEKIFNAMLHGHIFLFLGPARSLEWLRTRGYNTFDSIIDTSYDSIEDAGARLIAARKSIINFLDQPLDKIKDLYKSVLPQLLHNKKHVIKQRPDLEIRDTLKDILYEHRKTN